MAKVYISNKQGRVGQTVVGFRGGRICRREKVIKKGGKNEVAKNTKR